MAQERPQTVRAACPVGHVVEADVEEVEITHTRDTLIGVSFRCDDCRASISVDVPPASVALLLAMGVRIAREPLGPDYEPVACSAHRRVLSDSVLRRDVHADLP